MPNEWIEIEPVSGRDSGQIILRYGKNDTSSGRSATVRIWNSDFKITATTVITQSICPPEITGITLNASWTTDIPASGGTADKDNCTYSVYAIYSDGNSVDVTDDATIEGSQYVSSSKVLERHSSGTLTLGAFYEGFSITKDITIYQEAYVPVLTGISITAVWVNDMPASGGTITRNNFNITGTALYDVGGNKDITNTMNVSLSGNVNVPSSTDLNRHSVGNITVTGSYSGFTDSEVVTAYQVAYVPVLTGISMNVSWKTDIPASGGTITKDNFNITGTALYDVGGNKDITDTMDVTLGGTLTIPSSTNVNRHSVGNITVTGTYSGFTDSEVVTAYQSAAEAFITLNPTNIDMNGEYQTTTINVSSNIEWDTNISEQ